MNNAYYILGFTLLFYILAIAFLVFRYFYVSAHEEKYDSLLQSERYVTSEWYWPENKEYEKGDPPDHSGVAGAFAIVGIMAWQYISMMTIHFLNAKAWGCSTPFSTYGGFQVVVLFAEVILSFVIGEWITMFSKRPVSLSHSFSLFPRQRKSQACKKMTVIMIAVFSLLYPLRIAGLLNSGAFDDSQVVYRAPFQIETVVFNFAESNLDSKEDTMILVNPQGDELTLRRSLTTEDYDPVADDIVELYKMYHAADMDSK